LLDPFLKVRKWILLGSRGDWCIELGGIEAFIAAPELVKLGLGDICPSGDGSSLGHAKGSIDLDYLEHILKANRDGGDKAIWIQEGEGVPVSLAKEEEVKDLRDPSPFQCLGQVTIHKLPEYHCNDISMGSPALGSPAMAAAAVAAVTVVVLVLCADEGIMP